eukprot:CAMPEP_0174700808 /NCGR_PEP_ID=MMETSP1094-20130205/5652_1 /TAXON_ID=156173 /ORGANISM="Chrysochromulina brevifilum, Strain UTEX LB 985" /LENGTH=116 /DNA_ID=CAMNT_0015898355 /DNA_START=148 /DNA_END=499 /DNA_ORIENTATION=-
MIPSQLNKMRLASPRYHPAHPYWTPYWGENPDGISSRDLLESHPALPAAVAAGSGCRSNVCAQCASILSCTCGGRLQPKVISNPREGRSPAGAKPWVVLGVVLPPFENIPAGAKPV